MKKIRSLITAFAVLLSPFLCQGAAPSDESILKLLEVTNVRALLDQMLPQIDAMMKGAMDQALAGQQLTPSQQKIVEKMMTKTNDLLKEELDWGRLETMYTAIYREAFTQEEIDGMLQFYSTPAGQALIKKMPVVLQKSMTAMQARMGPLMEKMQKLQAEVLAELEADAKQ